MGWTRDYQAWKNRQCVLEPRRDRPESDKLGGIFRQVGLRQDTPLNPREDLEHRGLAWYREWCLHRRGENLVGPRRGPVSFIVVSGRLGNRRPCLLTSISRGGAVA